MAKPRRTRPARPATPAVRSVTPDRGKTPGESLGLWLRAGLIVVTGALVYGNSLSGPFTFDDDHSVVYNAQIRQLWPLSAVLSPLRPDQPVAGRPLVSVSFAINYAIGGLNVRGYHAGNIGLHILCALLLFGVVRSTLVAPRLPARFAERTATNLAFVGALIWMVHPLQTETVDYISARTESMMSLFYLLTLYTSIRALGSHRSAIWLVLSVLSCAMGMACKEAMVTAPLMVVLYDRTFVFASLKEALRARGKFYVGLAATWLGLAALLWVGPRGETVGFSTGITPWIYLLNQSMMIARYLRLAFWPRLLVLDYGTPQPLTLAQAAPSGAVIVILLLLTIAALRWRPAFGFLGAWFFVILAPTSSFIPIATEVGAERRMYLPLAAIVMQAVITGHLLWQRCASAADPSSRRWRVQLTSAGMIAAIVLVCGALAAGTVRRNAEYQSDLTLWRGVLERRPGPRAHRNVAAALKVAGNREETLFHMREAVRDDPQARYGLGRELFDQGELSEAVEELQRALRERPLDTNVIAARWLITRALISQGKPADAAEQLRVILKATPADASALEMLADALLAQGDFEEASVRYLELLKSKPADAGVWSNLGVTLEKTGHADQAARAFGRAVELDPQNGKAQGNLAGLLLDRRDFAGAVMHAKEAVRLMPRDADAHALLGLALVGQLEFAAAVDQFRAALDIEPTHKAAREYLEGVLRLREK